MAIAIRKTVEDVEGWRGNKRHLCGGSALASGTPTVCQHLFTHANHISDYPLSIKMTCCNAYSFFIVAIYK
jgi:hypothetical protein